MNTIDLSKVWIGDKFRTRVGEIVEYVGKSVFSDSYIVRRKNGCYYHVYVCGILFENEEDDFDLVEQVFDEPLDAIERDARINRDMQKIAEIADEERQELQRRQEVVELAEKLFTRGTMKDWFYELLRNNKVKTTYVEYIFAYAEEFVNTREKYLKEGKL